MLLPDHYRELSTDPRVRALQEGREPEPRSPHDVLLAIRSDGGALLHLCSLRALAWISGGKIRALPSQCEYMTTYRVSPDQIESARADIARAGLTVAFRLSLVGRK